MYYYKIGDKICCSFNGNLSYEKAEMPHPGTPLTFLFERELGTGRDSFKVNSPLLLFQEAENVSWLSSRKLEAQAAKKNCELDEAVEAAITQDVMRAVNRLHPDFEAILAEKPQKTKKRVHVLAIGDVGSTLLTGLHLLGGDCISSIGICDISDKVTARWEFEENQIAYPWAYDALPEVDVVKPEDLFKCDVFVFVASKGIPPVGSGVKDVRMYQFENNSKIVAQYARQARTEHFKGLFAVVSDPVDPLAKTAWLESNKDENGVFDLKGLRPEQVQGFGLGVMNARAAYYAKRDGRFSQFLTEGRSFGTAWTGSRHRRFHCKLQRCAFKRTDPADGNGKPAYARDRFQAVYRTGIFLRRNLPDSDDARRMALRFRLHGRYLHGSEKPLYRIWSGNRNSSTAGCAV